MVLIRPDARILAAHRPRSEPGPLARFWVRFAWETCTRRRVLPLARARLSGARPPRGEGLEHLPADGSFVLAANHYLAGTTLDAIAATLLVADRRRAGLAERVLLIAGRRARRRPRPIPLPARLVRRLMRTVYRRWAAHVLRIPWENHGVSIARLREWRRRVRRQPALVFPEGRAQLVFGAVRPGGGRWLASLGVPVLPTGVWWQDGTWRVRFGPPLVWSRRPELRDAQIGLAIAELLPEGLQGAWRQRVVLWRAAHAGPDQAAAPAGGARRG